jgi:hypothetical protein
VDIAEIRSSGILELYALDQLSPAEKAEVEGYLVSYPELREDLKEIERSLEFLAMSAAKPAPPGLKGKILDEIRKTGPQDKSGSDTPAKRLSGIWSTIAALLGLGLLVGGYYLMQKNNRIEQLEQVLIAQRDSCNQSTQQLNAQLDILRQLTFPDNKILPFQATPGFASTDLYLHYNVVTGRSFIQVRNLPALATNQSFQLWSLKPNQAPTPLTVFDIPSNGLIEVAFEAGTDTYAITIEPKGGRQTPTLENLIGTVSVAGM